MGIGVQKIAQNFSKKIMFPLTVASATLLASTALKAQEPKTDTVEISQKELVDKAQKKDKNHGLYVAMGIAYLLGMGTLAFGEYIIKGIGKKGDNK